MDIWQLILHVFLNMLHVVLHGSSLHNFLMNMMQILSSLQPTCSKRRLWLQRPWKMPSEMDHTRAPPQWLQHWRRFMAALFQVELLLAKVMIQAVRLRIRSKMWLQAQDPMDLNEKEMLFKKATSACQHETIQRSGNKHGRYSKCLVCGKRWVWEESSQTWTEPKASKAPRQLPLPSSSTATTWLDKGYTPAAFRLWLRSRSPKVHDLLMPRTPHRRWSKIASWSVEPEPSPWREAAALRRRIRRSTGTWWTEPSPIEQNWKHHLADRTPPSMPETIWPRSPSIWGVGNALWL